MTLIAVTGYKNSGKDSVCNVLRDVYGFKVVGVVDALKEQLLAIDPYIYLGPAGVERLSTIVATFGWDYTKEEFPEVRRLLQKAGTEGGRAIFGWDIWVETWRKRVDVLLEQEFDVCENNMRFLNEAKAVKNLGGQIWRVHRPGTSAGSHLSEKELDSIIPDHVIRNDGSLADLHGLVVGAMLS